MPLTALLAGVELDSTVCSTEEWLAIHRQRPRPELACRACGASMHARVSKRGLRHFAHDKRQPTCPVEGESPEHHHLKSLVARLARDLGYRAELEVASASDAEDAWRADVLVLTPSGRRFAFEIQLSAMSMPEGRHRTERYASAGIATVWLSSRHPGWMCQLPSVHISESGSEDPVADRGLARFDGQRWIAQESLPLIEVISGILDGTMTKTESPGEFVEMVAVRRAHNSAEVTVSRTTRDATVLVRTSDLKRHRWYQEGLDRRREEQQRAQAEAAQDAARTARERSANIAAMKERRYRLLQRVVAGLQAMLKPDEAIWLAGQYPERWDGGYPVPLELASGTASSAFGALAGIGSLDMPGMSWVVICPTASRCDTEMGAEWREHAVCVGADTPREAHMIARALGWRAHEVEIIGPQWKPQRRPQAGPIPREYLGLL